MAIAPTGDIYKSLSFDNTSSRTYGVYITGEAVYNAPERDVEMITIPGRNGAFALDNGRFQNIEVTYPAGIFAETEADFAQAISDFRNFLCSKEGYCRLTDEYNPNEYRMAVYKSGLEVTPAQLRAGEFNIVFECMPQRWLTSGESAVTIANSGDTITNPTLFEARPLLDVVGYGTMVINGHTVELDNIYLGNVKIADAVTGTKKSTKTTDVTDTQTLDDTLLNIGDVITVNNARIIARAKRLQGFAQFNEASVTSVTNCTASCSVDGSGGVTVDVELDSLAFTNGTSSTVTATVTFSATSPASPTPQTTTFTLNISTIYDGANDTITYSRAFSESFGAGSRYTQISAPNIYGDSTQSALGNPTHIDCENGNAYKIENGVIISLNHVIDLGSDLPKLATGINTITYDNTITQLKVVPRWWKI